MTLSIHRIDIGTKYPVPAPIDSPMAGTIGELESISLLISYDGNQLREIQGLIDKVRAIANAPTEHLWPLECKGSIAYADDNQKIRRIIDCSYPPRQRTPYAAEGDIGPAMRCYLSYSLRLWHARQGLSMMKIVSLKECLENLRALGQLDVDYRLALEDIQVLLAWL
jgi:hypothetical protein